MNTLRVSLLIAVVLLVSPPSTDAFIGNLINGVLNVANGALQGASNVVTGVQTAVQVAQLTGQFLWDNAVAPSLEVLQNNTATLLEDYFGGLLGKRMIDGDDKRFLALQLKQKLQLLIESLKEIYFNVFNQLQLQVDALLPEILNQNVTISQILAGLADSAKTKIKELVQKVLSELFSNKAAEIDGLGQIVRQQIESIDSLFFQAVDSVGSIFDQNLQ